MRPLNRPMFRYGGPIKEGVMSGIREPKRGGGSMKAALVGNPVFPRTGGREHHAAQVALLGIPAAVTAARTAAMRYLPRIVQGAKRMFGTTTPTTQRVMSANPMSATAGGTSIYKNIAGTPKFNPNWLGRDPIVRTIGAGGKAIFNPTVGGWAGKGLRFATSPSTLIIGGLYYANGRWFNKDGTPANKEDIAAAKATQDGPPGGGDPGMQGTGEWFAAQAEKEALAKEQKDWNNRIKRYRDIMDIKGMNKEAAYKSLIDASKLIQESQDFKGDIKSGKLINQVIQAASKQFDKPSKTSDAINTLILQNELKKDLNKETTALDKAYKQSAIALNEAKLAENSLAGDIRAYTAKNQALPAGNTLAGYAKGRGYDIESVASTTEVKNWMTKNGKTEVEFLQEVIQNNPGNVKPGNHVINDKIFNVSEDLQITGQIV